MPLAFDLINSVLLSIPLLLYYRLIIKNEHSMLIVFVLTFYSKRLPHISFPGMAVDHTIIIFDQFHPSTLSQVKISLRGKILKTFVIGVDETLFSVKIVSSYFQ